MSPSVVVFGPLSGVGEARNITDLATRVWFTPGGARCLCGACRLVTFCSLFDRTRLARHRCLRNLDAYSAKKHNSEGSSLKWINTKIAFYLFSFFISEFPKRSAAPQHHRAPCSPPLVATLEHEVGRPVDGDCSTGMPGGAALERILFGVGATLVISAGLTTYLGMPASLARPQRGGVIDQEEIGRLGASAAAARQAELASQRAAFKLAKQARRDADGNGIEMLLGRRCLDGSPQFGGRVKLCNCSWTQFQQFNWTADYTIQVVSAAHVR